MTQQLQRERPARARPPWPIIVAYAMVWIATAIAPHDRVDWLLENVLVVAFIGILLATFRRFQFSTTAYALMALLLGLHAIGAHHTYSETPLGRWAGDALGIERNHYDRAIHFAFGVLMATPMYELLGRGCGLRVGLARTLVPAALLACSGLYELIEFWTAHIVDPTAALAFVGAQGDAWDAQRDMTAAAVGSTIWWLSSTVRAARRSGASPRLGSVVSTMRTCNGCVITAPGAGTIRACATRVADDS